MNLRGNFFIRQCILNDSKCMWKFLRQHICCFFKINLKLISLNHFYQSFIIYYYNNNNSINQTPENAYNLSFSCHRHFEISRSKKYII